MGFGDPGCYGNPHIQTPRIDQLAHEGMRLTDCYAAGPVCSPARAGMLTGRVPTRVGVYDWICPAKGHNFMHLPANEITVATLLRQAGYETSLFGKWHLTGRFNRGEQPGPSEHGFDYWFATEANLSHQKNPDEFLRNGEKVPPLAGYACEVVADEAIEWIAAKRDPAKPFLQCLWFHEPHEPIDSPSDIVAQYDKHDGTKPLYYANVTNVDRQIGRVLDKLDALGLNEETFVLFTSDNGPAELEQGYRARSHGTAGPFRGYKWSLYEGGIRVPGIIRWPGHVEAGSECDEPVSGVDILPTFCAIAEIDTPERPLDGADITPIFDGQTVLRRKPLHWHYSSAYEGPQAVMREGDYVITADWDRSHPNRGRFVRQTIRGIKEADLINFRLYNVRRDPGQERNLSAAEPQRFARLREQLMALHREVQAEAPTWESTP